MEVVESFLKKHPCYKAGKKIQVKGLMLHSVGCPQPSAQRFVEKWNADTPEAARACVHAFIDGITGKVYQTLPWDYKAWHCGGAGNSSYIGVEMCEPACIKYTGGTAFACTDTQQALQVVERTYASAVELFAYLCKRFDLDPLKDGVIISHKEGHDRGIASGHGDPDHLWRGLPCGHTMDGFRKAVAEAMNAVPVPSPTPEAKSASSPQNEPSVSVPSQGTKSIKPGDVVVLAPDATYDTGKEMPSWVKQDSWIVKSVNGERIVLGSNENGSHEINSLVNAKYLTVVKSGMGTPGIDIVTKPVTPPKIDDETKPMAPPIASQMSVSDRGVELVAKFEGCRLEAYKCPAGVWTIGYGHTQGVKPGDRLPSVDAAKALLKEDLAKYAGYVNECVRDKQITFPLTQNQFDALTSFCYNLGKGGLKMLVTGRDAKTVAEKMLEYNKGGGKVLSGLTKRRAEEQRLFLS